MIFQIPLTMTNILNNAIGYQEKVTPLLKILHTPQELKRKFDYY